MCLVFENPCLRGEPDRSYRDAAFPGVLAIDSRAWWQDATFDFEKRRNRPVKYDRETMGKTLLAMKKVNHCALSPLLLSQGAQLASDLCLAIQLDRASSLPAFCI